MALRRTPCFREQSVYIEHAKKLTADTILIVMCSSKHSILHNFDSKICTKIYANLYSEKSKIFA